MNAQPRNERSMHRYELSTPRLAIGTAAVALSAIAMAVMVIIPATIEAEAHDGGSPVTLAWSRTGAAGELVEEHERASEPCAPQGSELDSRP
ncbi:MAG TPA: hypothetical protein VMN79_04145 [Casimicrobiaceae bacterium]|nr:hypothetical protein [Casimicrobiaceae bacterium]